AGGAFVKTPTRSSTSAHGTEPSADLGKTMSASCALATCAVETPPPQPAATNSNPRTQPASLTGRLAAEVVRKARGPGLISHRASSGGPGRECPERVGPFGVVCRSHG